MVASGSEISVGFNLSKVVSNGGNRAESGSLPSGVGPIKLLN